MEGLLPKAKGYGEIEGERSDNTEYPDPAYAYDGRKLRHTRTGGSQTTRGYYQEVSASQDWQEWMPR